MQITLPSNCDLDDNCLIQFLKANNKKQAAATTKPNSKPIPMQNAVVVDSNKEMEDKNTKLLAVDNALTNLIAKQNKKEEEEPMECKVKCDSHSLT